MRDLNSAYFRGTFSERQQREADVIPVHLPSLASVCGDSGSHKGFAKDGWMVCLAGLPGHGKSISAINFACAALDAGEPVAYVSLEMSAEQLAARYYAMKTGIEVSLLEQGNFNERAFEIVSEKTNYLPPIYVPDEITSDWQHCADFIKECVEDYNVQYVILDYLQICNSGNEQNIYKAMAELMTDLRSYAVQRQICILVLSQFNRETASQYKLRPRMSGLWGGSIIEQVCDMILLLGHHAYERDNENKCARTWLLVEKNRHGSCVDIPLFQSYKDLSQREGLEDELSDWPKP
jgi:replicative DNA helicase